MSDYGYGAIPAVVLLFIVLGIQKYRASARDRQIARSVHPTQPLQSTDDLSWLIPPRTLVDASAWDTYWQQQFSHGFGAFVQQFADLFCDDGDLVDFMRADGLRTVLCVGNGISQEPRALEWAGFDVTALDLSPFAAEKARTNVPSVASLARLIGNRSQAPGGRLEFVTGDLCDPDCCPGPYDVVIDRRTLQLYPDEERPRAMQAVANRLASRGIFFSQCHDGAWKPPAEPRHATREWFVANGWQMWTRDKPLTGRVAWLFTTTG